MENKQDIDFLNKETEPLEINSDKYQESVKFIQKLTDSFAYEDQFSGDGTYEYIKNFISKKTGLNRILYSELNKRIESASNSKNSLDIMVQNVKTLFDYAKSKYNYDNISKDDEDCINIITKIFDHINLYKIQKERLEIQSDSLKSEVTKAVKEQAIKDIKTGIEREYITILSIFSAFILAFVGSLAYSNSALANIDKVSLQKLLLICDIIGFFIYNIISTLIWLVLKINGIETIFFYNLFKDINAVIIIIGIATLCANILM